MEKKSNSHCRKTPHVQSRRRTQFSIWQLAKLTVLSACLALSLRIFFWGSVETHEQYDHVTRRDYSIWTPPVGNYEFEANLDECVFNGNAKQIDQPSISEEKAKSIADSYAARMARQGLIPEDYVVGCAMPLFTGFEDENFWCVRIMGPQNKFAPVFVEVAVLMNGTVYEPTIYYSDSYSKERSNPRLLSELEKKNKETKN